MSRLVLLALLVGCGPSLATINTARDARYDAPFSTVWNVIVEEVRRRYPSIEYEDAIDGAIATTWRMVDAADQDPANATSANTKATSGTQGSTAVNPTQSGTSRFAAVPGLPLGLTEANLVRMRVRVKGPPWTIIVEGEGANLQPGLKLSPYRRGAIDEPPWVQTRIDNLTAAIYEKLKQYAIKTEKPKQAEKPLDTTAWKNLTDKAVIAVIGAVRKAAAARDTAALRSYMAPDFRWAAGADGSADTALAMWSADPTALKSLASTLDGGCASDNSGDVVCSANGTARFRQVGQGWKFVEFTAR